MLTAILEQIRALVARGEVRVSLHGYEELAADNVPVRDIIDGLTAAEALEEYPSYPKGPASWFSNKTRAIGRFTWSGEFRPARIHRRSWSRHTGPILRNGMRHGEGGGNERQVDQATRARRQLRG